MVKLVWVKRNLVLGKSLAEYYFKMRGWVLYQGKVWVFVCICGMCLVTDEEVDADSTGKDRGGVDDRSITSECWEEERGVYKKENEIRGVGAQM